MDLGAGVHVAQRDLTIRGTGEVFGEKQSGKLSTEIGADLFNEMLFDSLYRAQTETLPKVQFDDVKVGGSTSAFPHLIRVQDACHSLWLDISRRSDDVAQQFEKWADFILGKNKET